LRVVNPFAEKLTFLDDRTRTRRDHTKYLALIRVIALLHQHQRAVKRVTRDGREIEYIEATAGDIAAANALAHEVLGRCLDEMPPQTRRLLELLETMVAARCAAAKIARADVRFSRRTVREHTGWGDTQLRVHLTRLLDLEYLIAHRAGHGNGFVYELAYDGGGKDGKRFLSGLIDVEKLLKDAPATPKGAGQNTGCAGQNGQGAGDARVESGLLSGGSRGAKKAVSPSEKPAADAKKPKNAHQADTGKTTRKPNT